MVTLMPYAKQRTREELLQTLRRLAGYLPEVSARTHEQAWDRLRTVIRPGR